MPQKIYFDTNVLRYFVDAFGNAPVDVDLKQHLVVSPISVLELLSEIGTDQAEAAFRTVKVFPNIFDANNPIPLLPWEDEVFRVLVFDQAPQPDQLAELLSNAMTRAFHADCVEDIREDGRELRNVLDQAKLRATNDFSALLNSFRQHGAVAEDEHRQIFANGIAHRAGVPREGVNVDRVIDRLSALWAYEYEHVMNSAGEQEYDPYRHQNDFLDIEQLVYLAHPDLHLLTSDQGFRKARESAQYR
ncbi:MAG TPA: hypothetical protein VGF88_22500 [Acidobacteriaceae bacterium]|jgi:hypothetical protein